MRGAVAWDAQRDEILRCILTARFTRETVMRFELDAGRAAACAAPACALEYRPVQFLPSQNARRVASRAETIGQTIKHSMERQAGGEHGHAWRQGRHRESRGDHPPAVKHKPVCGALSRSFAGKVGPRGQWINPSGAPRVPQEVIRVGQRAAGPESQGQGVQPRSCGRGDQSGEQQM